MLAEPGECSGWPAEVEVVIGSIGQPLPSAEIFAGVDAVFLAGAHPSTVEASLRSAGEAGVQRIVLLSSHGPEYEQYNPPETWHWLAIERAVERSGSGGLISGPPP